MDQTKFLEIEEIQGYVIDNYDPMLYSRYDFLQVTDPAKAKHWLGEQALHLTTVEHAQQEMGKLKNAFNIACTAPGLAALGMDSQNIDAFSKEFREGIVTPHRQRLLGDFGASDPKSWIWGNPDNDAIHVVLLIFGTDKDTCLTFAKTLEDQYLNSGFRKVRSIEGQTLEGNKEHFGFRDGISQPIIQGSGVKGPEHDIVKAGEFIMGYENEYNVLPESPLIVKEQGDMNILPPDAGDSGKKDLGRNGTYLVLRQMDQDVNAFWEFMNEKTRNSDGSLNEQESIKLAAKMVGRWPSGAPLSKYPDADPGGLSNDNDFGYHDTDPDGTKCPFGSHLRRANPRDSFEDNNAKTSWKLTKKHRIMRRARLYGEPIIGTPTDHKTEGEVGLVFHSFNADISRQFEFVQFTWANSTKVKNLYNDPDPIIGTKEESVEDQVFTIQDKPYNKNITGLKRFVTIRGGAYCFFPSISALRYISTL